MKTSQIHALSEILRNIQVSTIKSDQILQVFSFPSKREILSPNPKTLLYHLRKGEITFMDKEKKILTEPIEEDMIDTRRQRGKCLYNILFPTKGPELESIEEVYEEAITCKQFLKGGLA